MNLKMLSRQRQTESHTTYERKTIEQKEEDEFYEFFGTDDISHFYNLICVISSFFWLRCDRIEGDEG
ncbi:hypothetical protein VINI7043_21851 [Vibrio nigripulchritudo ATCC 27043]|uniref:hypothetical protein n=1 Tax=Vibrio nigripulchritudo TaxID=28173 RepID=UPI00021C2E74|nr:hypothetical protein [Vibrio nigripulchritudo]EGU50020.1 hypothetical protein VINI7043_21851 [Vibrio nigripulchritudo ATCC 27043]